MKYVPSALIGQLSGSQGSTTASRNRYSSYLRNRVMPVNPNTPAQTLVRNNLDELARTWRTLTAAQREGWGVLGSQIIRSNSLGQQYDLPGINAYVGVNMTRFAFAQARIDDAPAFTAPPTLTTITLTATNDPDFLSLAFTPTPLETDTRLIVRATGAMSAGRSFFPRSDFKQVLATGAAPSSPLNLLTNWEALFGELVAGPKVALEVVPVSSSFIPGTPLRTVQIVS